MAPSPIACCSGLRAIFRWKVAQDAAVDAGFDALQLIRRDRLGVGEVKAQAVGRHQRACLAGVLAQFLAQFGMQQVGGGVVAHDITAALCVHLGNSRLANLGCAPDHLARCARSHRRLVCAYRLRRSPRQLSAARITPVSETCPPRLDIEACIRQEDFDRLPRGGHIRPALHPRSAPAVCLPLSGVYGSYVTPFGA